MSKDFNEAVDVLFHKVDDLVSTKTVVGDAIVVGDMTLLPLIDVAVGAGVGAKESANAAGGMGARIRMRFPSWWIWHPESSIS